MKKICKRCGQPVIINQDYYDVFEGMHWLCFHLSFEHGNYDPDEPCDDPSCPWNRISESYRADYSERNWDIKLIACNSRQLIEMKLVDWESKHLPSLCTQIGFLGGVVGYKGKKVWYELSEVNNFIDSLNKLNEKYIGRAVLKSMSPREFEMEIENIDKFGHFVLKYSFTFYEYIGDHRVESLINSGFEIDLQTICKLANGFTKMINMRYSNNP